MDRQAQSELATKNAERLLIANGFGDILPLNVITYTDEEINEYYNENNQNWVGQYATCSIDSEDGLTVFLAIDKHESHRDMLDTILHEVGHGVWETIDNNGQQEWLETAKDDPHGPHESFADHTMYVLQGLTHLAFHADLFNKLTRLNEAH